MPPCGVIDRLFRDRRCVARFDGSVHDLFPVAIDADEGQALRTWVVREKALRTIEVGLGYGVAALFICDGLLANGDAAARHLAIDPHQQSRFANCALQFLDDAGVLELVEHHSAESHIVLPRLLAEGHAYDLAFVDGNHRFDGVFVDLVYLDRLVRRGGIVIVDDYQLRSVSRAVAFFTANIGWAIEEVCTDAAAHHWAVLRTPRVRPLRAFDHFVDF